MSVQSLYVLLVALAARYLPYRKVRSARVRAVLPFVFMAIMVCPLMYSGNILLYALLVVCVELIDVRLLGRGAKPEGRRFLATALVFAIVIVSMNTDAFDDGLSRVMYDTIAALRASGPAWAWMTVAIVAKVMTIAIGFMLVVVESNYAVVFLLKSFSAFPKEKGDEGGVKHRLGMGQLIGMLERALLYILIVSGNFSTIGFVIAAKALARFKELENKNFAEYFLVGTMASVCLTMLVGLAVVRMTR